MRIRAAIAAILCCICFTASGDAAKNSNGTGIAKGGSSETSDANPQPTRAASPTKDSPLLVQVVQTEEETKASQEQNQKTDQFNKEYLDTQERMARASEQQLRTACILLIVAVTDTLVALTALLFLRKTFIEAKRSADAADATLQETKRSNEEQSKLTRDEIKRADAAEEYRDLRAKEDQKIARESAAAATRAAETLPTIERAYVFVVVTRGKIFGDDHDGRMIELDVQFFNHGRTPAIITKMIAGNAFGPNPPQKLPQSCKEADISPGLVVAGSGSYPIALNMHLLSGDYSSVVNGDNLAFCFGVIEYKDVLGTDRATGFCWQWGRKTNQKFVISPGTPLNYFN